MTSLSRHQTMGAFYIEFDLQGAWAKAKKGQWDAMLDLIATNSITDMDLYTLSSRKDSSFGPLHYAAKWGRKDACEAIVKTGYKPYLTDKYNRRPDKIAASYGHLKLADWLQCQFATDAGNSSTAYGQSGRTRMSEIKKVWHNGHYVIIPYRCLHFVDNKGKVLIGANDSFSPPVDKRGIPLVVNWQQIL
ncbi:ankyrin repeat protein [Mollivirus sibericum]|uniref:ankyrin repeat protein n=1 Tax=Mollivirus sibericum TaxID=1678078 RepID=UPI0006B2DD55|nr:ankyrin repeat protein [Mollivirus sibericum]ALD62255.1 ankyrin repeat protein [Mollivirus sibericum]